MEEILEVINHNNIRLPHLKNRTFVKNLCIRLNCYPKVSKQNRKKCSVYVLIFPLTGGVVGTGGTP
jgi:hypothetical protein